jgi:hypothetical protein
MSKQPDQYDDEEAQSRFEAALKSALNTPHKPTWLKWTEMTAYATLTPRLSQ